MARAYGILVSLLLAFLLSGCAATSGPAPAPRLSSPQGSSSPLGTSSSPTWSTPDGSMVRCPGHWHATFHIVLDSHQVSFADPEFYLEGNRTMPIATHLHKGNDYEWHFEPNPARCIPLWDANRRVAVAWNDTGLTLWGAHAHIPLAGTDRTQGGSYIANASHALQFFLRHPDQDWQATTGLALAGAQLQDGDRVLVLYGNYSDDQVTLFEASVPLASNYQRAHPGSS